MNTPLSTRPKYQPMYSIFIVGYPKITSNSTYLSPAFSNLPMLPWFIHSLKSGTCYPELSLMAPLPGLPPSHFNSWPIPVDFASKRHSNLCTYINIHPLNILPSEFLSLHQLPVFILSDFNVHMDTSFNTLISQFSDFSPSTNLSSVYSHIPWPYHYQ